MVSVVVLSVDNLITTFHSLQALRLIIVFLAARLPGNVRFIFSSRPEAAVGSIREILLRTFNQPLKTGQNSSSCDGIEFIEPSRLRLEMESSVDVITATENPSDVSIPPKQVTAKSMTTSTEPCDLALAASSLLPGVAGSVKLFLTVCSECGLDQKLQKV